uniref:Uncharacterized protein n=2 Tax=Amphimedon queenslandica TaxID=400682 RepID=A0A1X7TJU3_AMPQE
MAAEGRKIHQIDPALLFDEIGDTALIVAAEEGDYDVVELLLNNGADKKAANFFGKTALVAAVREGHEKVVQLLCDEADPDITTHNNELYEAAARGDSTVVQSALSQGANVNYQNPEESGATSLHVAAKKGYHDVVKILVSAGADVNLIDADEVTALIDSAREGHYGIVQLLLEKRARPNTIGDTALIAAAEEGHYDIVQLLLNNGADRSTANYSGETALVAAARGRYDKIVKLLSEETDPDVTIHNDKLYEAAKRGDSTGVQSALSQGANVNYQNLNEDGVTSLHVAAKEGYVEVVQNLVSAGANVNLIDTDGYTALIKSAEEGHYEIAELLLKSGADPNTDGDTALIESAREGHYEIVQLLLSNGADRNASNFSGETAVVAAATEGHNNIVQLLSEEVDPIPTRFRTTLVVSLESSGQDKSTTQNPTFLDIFATDSNDSDRANTTSTIRFLEEIDQKYLQEAMEDGLVESFVTKTTVQGEARVGKSSVKSLLVSELYTDKTSTNCIEPPCVAVMCYGQTGKYWERINEEEMGIKVITAVQSDAVKRLRVKKNPSKPLRQIDQHLDGKASKPKSQNESVKNSQPMDDDPLSSAVTSNTPVTIEFSNEKDAFVRVRKFYQKCKKYQKEGTSFCGRRWLYFIDSGGQIQFQKLLPAFMPYASVLLLVVSLSKDLNEPSSTAMQLSERKINVSERSLSVIEILKQLLSAIASSTQRYRSLIADDPLLSELITPPSDKLKVLPVATHPDEYEEALKKGKESSDDKRKKINEIAHRHESCEIVGHEGRIYLYKVDGSKARNKVFEDLQPDSDLYKIAQALEKNHYKIKVPLKWYCFGVLLHDVAKEGCGVLSLSYCQELGQQLEVNLSADKSLSAIKFLSFLNKLLFYPDSPAGDLVFVNIESLFNILKDLLVFVCDAHSDAKFLLSDQKALVCKGHLSIEILKKASKSCNKISKAFSDFETKLLGLFEYLLIATKLPEKDTFFMPALLPIKDVSDINPYPNTIPLLFYFENAIPMGLFCAVIVHLLSEKEASWKVIEESNFSNYFTLQCPDLLESIIILVEQVDCIALYCEAEDDYIPAREAMEEAVDAAMLAHKLSEKPKKAFYCPCGKGRHENDGMMSYNIYLMFWSQGENGHMGLWQNCSNTKCQGLSNPSGAVIGVRAMLCMSLMSGLIGWAVGMVALIVHRPRFLFTVALAFGIQAFLWFIGLLVYTKELKSNKGASQGWSYSIGWLGFFLVVFSVVYYVFAGVYRLKKPQSSVIQQIYAPLTQWDDVSSSDSEDDRL